MNRGVDVSVFNGQIDFNAAKAAGVSFVYIKATQGREVYGNGYLFCDRNFSTNIQNAVSAGLDVGVYHYLTAANVDEAIIEADFFLRAIEPYRDMITLHAVVDVEEDKYLPRDRAELTAIVDIFCDRVSEAGYKPLVYTNPNYLKNRFDNHNPLWLALWRDESLIPREYDAVVWQYSDSGRIDGIGGKVDMNLYLKEREGESMGENEVFDNAPAEWAKEAVKWAQENGIVYGDENGNLKLRESCTREQMLVFLYRVYKLITEGMT